MGVWSYSICKIVNSQKPEEPGYYAVHEVHSDNQVPWGITETEDSPAGNNREEFKQSVGYYLNDLLGAVLIFDTAINQFVGAEPPIFASVAELVDALRLERSEKS